MNATSIIKQITGKKTLYDMQGYIANWGDWYKGKVAKFHNYRIFKVKRSINMERMTLGMAKRVCEDWANLLINEKTDITVGDKHTQEVLHKIYSDNDFWTKGNEGIEKTFALGIGAFVIGVDNLGVDEDGNISDTTNAKLVVKFVNGTKMFPITFKDEQITECAFVNVDSDITYITIHLIGEDGTYEIHNVVCNGKGNNLRYNADYEIFHTNSRKAWFFPLKPNVANNIDINNPLGISIFANSIDTLKEIDIIYDSYANEFILGKKRIFYSGQNYGIDPKTGEEYDVFDSNDVAVYVLPEQADGSTLITDQTQQLRVSDHVAALQNQLNLLAYKCGFGTEHYKFDAAGVTTATQIISENSEMFRNIKKHETLIERVLVDMSRAILEAVNEFTAETVNADAEITIKFDDSIIEDKGAERAQDRLDVTMGAMSKPEYRAKWYNEDIKTATKAIDELSTGIIEDENL